MHCTLLARLLHLVLCAGVVMAAPWGAAGPNLLLLWDDEEAGLSALPPPIAELDARTQSLVGAFQAAGVDVTLSNRNQQRYTGFNPIPNDFDVVLHLNGGASALNIMPTTAVGVLVDYVRQFNGAVITGEFTGTQLTIPFGQGISPAMADLMLVQRSSGVGVNPFTIFRIEAQADHPVLQGVPSQFTIRAARLVGSLRNYATDPAVTLMRDERSTPAVSVRDFGTGRVVSFNHAGNTGTGDVLSNTNMHRIYVNAVFWADRKPPIVRSISREGETPSQGGTLAWRVRFSESVTGVTPEDFRISAAPGVEFDEDLRIEEISDREYLVSVEEVSGLGNIGLNVVDDDSIVDTSVSRNPLGGVGAGNGNRTGDTYAVDAAPPALEAFTATPEPVPVGARGVFDLRFNKPMNTAVFPEVVVVTAGGATLTASPATAPPGNGAWVAPDLYRVSLDQSVTEGDQGTATVAVRNARDPNGVRMPAATGIAVDLGQPGELGGDLAVAITPPASLAPGTSAEYQIEILNNGPNAVTGASLRITLPVGRLLNPAWTCVGTQGGLCDPAGTGSLVNGIDLPAGGRAVLGVTMEVSLSASESLEFTAAISLPSGVIDPVAGNNIAAVETPVVPSGDLEVSIEADADVALPGATVVYTVVVRNQGPSRIDGAAVEADLPGGFTNRQWTCVGNAGGQCAAGPSTAALRDTVDLPPNATVTYTLSGRVPIGADGPQEARASATVPVGSSDPVPGNNSATAIVSAFSTALVRLNLDSEGAVAGDVIEVELEIDVGGLPLRGFDITIEYDPGIVTVASVLGGRTAEFSTAPTLSGGVGSGRTTLRRTQTINNTGPTGRLSVARVAFQTNAEAPGQSPLVPRVNELITTEGVTLPASAEPESLRVAADPGLRVADSVELLYMFAEPNGNQVLDVSGSSNPVDLDIAPANATRRESGVLEVISAARIAASAPDAALASRLSATGAITLEAWIQPAQAAQGGPARIFTFSSGDAARNFTLAQNGTAFEARIRTTATNDNADPALATAAGRAGTGLTHLVYTRTVTGAARIFVDGAVAAAGALAGGMGNWDAGHRIALANEFGVARPWLGEYHLIAVHSRALTEAEVAQNYAAGPDGQGLPEEEGEGEGTAEGEGQPEGETPEGEEEEGEGEPPCVLPVAPGGVTAGDGTEADRVRVRWNAVAGAATYGVFRATSNNPALATRIGTATTTEFSDLTAAPPRIVTSGGGCGGTQTSTELVRSFYWVRAENNCGASALGGGVPGARGASAKDLQAHSGGDVRMAAIAPPSAAGGRAGGMAVVGLALAALLGAARFTRAGGRPANP